MIEIGENLKEILVGFLFVIICLGGLWIVTKSLKP